MTEEVRSGTAAKSFAELRFTAEDLALFEMHKFDFEAQLVAISVLLKQNKAAEEETEKKIEQLVLATGKSGNADEEYMEYLMAKVDDELHFSTFQDAAHSMAAVGMLAPLMEALFVAVFATFRGVEEKVGNSTKEETRQARSNSQFWDPHYYFGDTGQRVDLVAGIVQLASFTGLKVHLPDDLNKTLSALFYYRNMMFHNGFEWPEEARKAFVKHLKNQQIPDDWFKKSTKAGDPWIFYMSDDFINHCLKTLDGVIEGFGKHLTQAIASKIG